MNPTDDMREVMPLIQGYMEGALSDAEAVALRTRLQAQPELVAIILDHLKNDALMRDHVRMTEQAESHLVALPTDLTATLPGRKETAGDSRGSRPNLQPRHRVPIIGLVGGLLVALVLVMMLLRTPAPTFARLTNAEHVTVQRNGRPLPGQDVSALAAGDLIQTGPEASAVIRFANEETELTLPPGTSLLLQSWRSGKELNLKSGRLLARVAKQPSGKPMRIETPVSGITVIGTEFGLAAGSDSTRLDVWEGRVRMTRTRDEASVEVPAGFQASAQSGDLTLLPISQSYPPGILGGIEHAFWLYLPGDQLADLTTSPRYPDAPDGVETLKTLELPGGWGVLHGSRFRAWIYPPTSGPYTFWIAGDDQAELRLSPDDSPQNAHTIASVSVATRPREFDRNPGQQSEPVALLSGHRYYLEVIYKQAMAPGGLSVAWQPPNQRRQILDGNAMAPFRDLNRSANK